MRLRSTIAVALFALALIFGRLGAFGLWDPSEIRVTEASRDSQTRAPTRPPLAFALPEAGLSFLGRSEGALRFPLAVCGVLCVLLLGVLGSRLVGQTAATWGMLVLTTCAGFLFHARQLTGDVLGETAGVLAWGGLGVAILDASRAWRAAGLIAAIVGLAIGFFCRGGLLGTLLPLAAVTLVFPRAWRGLLAATSLAWLAATIFSITHSSGHYVPLWGAVVRLATSPPPFDSALRPLAYALFPWTGVVLIAIPFHLGHQSRARHLLFSITMLSIAALLAFSWLTAGGGVSLPPFPALGALALAAGCALEDASADVTTATTRPVMAVCAACAAFIIGRDLLLSPDALLPALLAEGVKFPQGLRVGPLRPELVLLFLGIASGLASLVVWGGLPFLPASTRTSPVVRRVALGSLALVAGLCSGFLTQGLVPALSQHWSAKNVLADFHRLSKPGEKLLRYRIASHGAEYQLGQTIEDIRTQAGLLTELGKPERIFILTPASELASLDHAAREKSKPYYVLSAESSRTLLISNVLRLSERDRNPLRQFVTADAPNPRHALQIDFAGKVEMVGYDLPASIKRGQPLHVAFYFHVKERLPANYKLFMHFDQPSYRFNGDHEPLEGKLPTQHWTVGTYVVDRYSVDVPRITTPAGRYTVYMGFWKGDDRLKVVNGPQDGTDRVRLGSLDVQ